MLGETPVSTMSLLMGTEMRTLSRRATVPLVALLTCSKSMFLAARALRLSVYVLPQVRRDVFAAVRTPFERAPEVAG